ncbi:MAG TPA: 6-phosphogluconolactonase, partial [Candidatus Agrococcus pullicola]|nr:6-phosphogluconolactonase [Candidatus Agrococcus pullicola]
MAEVIIVDSAEEAGALVGGAIGDAISQKPEFVLGVATGSTPLTTYRSLAEVIRERGIDVSRVRAFALDEYLGLPEGHPESYRTVVDREVVNVLGLSPENVRVPDGDVSHAETACTDYELAIRAAGGVDVQLLGIGTSGHIGFNEPGSSL